MLLKKIYYKSRNIKNIFLKKIYAFYAKTTLKKINFSIICNNCYAGHLYEALNEPYNTPTVGLFFFAEDYINFIENIEICLTTELEFITTSKYKECEEEHNKLKYPIGLLLNKIEVHFLHYTSQKEAKEKWDRRKKRVNLNKLLIIMNDQNNYKESLHSKFKTINEKKVFLSAKKSNDKEVVWVKNYKNKNNVGDMYNEWAKCLPYFNLVKWVKNNQ